ncbi:MAG: hypothetical protein QF632_01770 [Candidatus Woesearchaeota archaeon]|jgi:hypothetical protein|nr:hypothetical protein [Candidatus Woesearchaeota archaeon]
MKDHDSKHLAWLVSLALVVIVGGVVFNTVPGEDSNEVTGAFWLADWLSGLIGRAHSICQECKFVGTEQEGYYCNEEVIELKKCAAGFQRACYSCWDGSDKCDGTKEGPCTVITEWKAKGEAFCAGKASETGKVGVKKVKPLWRCDRE